MKIKSLKNPQRALMSGLAGAMLVVTAVQADDAITSSVNVTTPNKQFTGDEWRSISLSANRILMHVDNAANALADKQPDAAANNIDQGLTLVKLLDGVLPQTTVKTVITGGGVTYTNEDQVAAAFVPIYREYDSVDVVSPVLEQQQGKANAKAASAPEDTYAGSDYTSITLDLRLARRDLLAAQGAMKASDATNALAALQDIEQNGVLFDFSQTRRPLARAMDNLQLAQSELASNHPAQVKVALQGAADALKNYEDIVGGSRAKEVQKLQEHIADVADKLPGQTPDDFSGKISKCWNQCRDWMNN